MSSQPAVGASPKRHPLAVPGVVLAACGIFPLPVVGGVLGALFGAVAGAASRRQPGRWAAPTAADAAVAVGAVTGFLPMIVLGAVRRDEWGIAPLLVTMVLVAVVGAIVVGGAMGARRAAAGAAAGVGIAVGTSIVVFGLALVAVWFIIFVFELLIDAIF